jgi:hypothetical protein
MAGTDGIIVGYTYMAENWCADHLTDRLIFDGLLSPTAWDMTMEEALDQHAEHYGIDRYDEWSFDSDDFPKIITHDMVKDDDPDNPTVCAKTGSPVGEC